MSSTVQPPTKLPKLDLNDTFGSLLIGLFFSAALFGVTCTQTFYYFQNYDSDGFIIKAAVVALLVLETLHSAFGIHAIYHYTILNYLNPAALAKPLWSLRMTQGISCGIILIVQLFYVRRVYYMSRKNIPLVVFITACAVARLGGGIAVTVQFFKLKVLSDFSGNKSFAHLGGASLALAVVTDVAIAASLSYYLHTSRSGVGSTDTMINRLMVYTINNGIMTSVFNIIVVGFLSVANVNNLLFFAIDQVVDNLYTNSLMATLNSRKSFKQDNAMSTFKFVAGTSTPVSTKIAGMESDTDNTHRRVKITSTEDGLAA